MYSVMSRFCGLRLREEQILWLLGPSSKGEWFKQLPPDDAPGGRSSREENSYVLQIFFGYSR